MTLDLDLLEILHPSMDEDILKFEMDRARSDAMAYCHLDELPASLDSVIFQMTEENINRHFADGYQSESVGGNSVSYLTDYSDKVYKVLNRYKHIQVVS